eukprot:CAMPEP_0117449176 /NCGR_PEP_ID=MMETSP0759-20121206/7805_1 /TAXON_ID=63605 /ORGANISM="Percolomonas cosmopolitus, Strain WS" /LENGTH=450 /DNA_ID=CAMNT_0005241633 /DNA_START=1638 /DNA_END=2990 /DNA_ORIENTATION=-
MVHKNTYVTLPEDSDDSKPSLAAQRADFLKSDRSKPTTDSGSTIQMESSPEEVSEEELRRQLFFNESSFATDFIRIDHKKGTRFVTLTREKALNALNHDMVKQLLPIYRAYNSDPTTKTIILKSDSRAFCAGGDIVSIVEHKDPSFFADEYKLDQLIATLSKPHVALWNGIVMGGGVGISVHGSFRVATENTLFAMPEVGIGFFPDVGGTYFLPRLANNYGFYLGLTGKKLKGKEVLDAGIANFYVPSSKLDSLQQLLVRMDSNSPVDVRNCIRHVHAESTAAEAPKDAAVISRVFDPETHSDVESIMADLSELEEEEEWAKKALESMRRASPSSLKVTFEALKRGKTLDFKDCFKMELVIAKQMLKQRDFAEGVRALLVDKDNSPVWSPISLEGISQDDVEFYFGSGATAESLGLDESQYDYETLDEMFGENATREQVEKDEGVVSKQE